MSGRSPMNAGRKSVVLNMGLQLHDRIAAAARATGLPITEYCFQVVRDSLDQPAVADWLKAPSKDDVLAEIEKERLGRPMNGDGSNYMLDNIKKRVERMEWS